MQSYILRAALFILNIISVSLFAQNRSTFTVLDESAEEIVIQFSLGDYSFTQAADGSTQIKTDGAGVILKKGAPELPYFAASFIIPDLGNTIAILENTDFEIINDIEIAPSKGNFTRDKNPNSIPRVKGAEYFSAGFFPSDVCKTNDPFIFRDFRGQSVHIYPFQYDALNKQLKVLQDLTFRINKNAGGAAVNEFYRSEIASSANQEFANIYKRHFLNFNSTLYTPLSERGDMLIIAHAPFIPLMDEFVQWKRQSGMKVQVVSLAQAGGAQPQAIKEFIRNKYESEGLAFVLLVGDHPQIPSLSSMGAAADPMFGFLLGDDAYPELIVGRLSAENEAHVSTQLRRFIDYEKAENMSFDYLKTCMQIASKEGPGDNDEFDHEHLQLIRQQLMNFTYSSAFEFYEGSQGGFDAPEDPTAGMVAEALNQGTGIINYTGHGWDQGWATSGFNNGDISSLQNDGKLPFIWSVACVNGDFANNTCFGEQWLRASRNGQPIGAVGAFMSTVNQYWTPPMAAQDEMVRLLTETNPLLAKRTYGGLSVNGCMKMNDLYEQAGYDMTETWHIFGDPSMMVRTDVPQQLQVMHPASIFISENSISLQVSIDRAYVSLYQNGTIIARGYALDGSAEFTFDPLSTIDPITVTVTAFNSIPYQGIVEILVGDQPFLSIVSMTIDDASGNANQLADYGEEITVNIQIQNFGNIVAQQVQAELHQVNGNAINLSNELLIGDIAPGATVNINQHFRFKVNDVINNNEPLQLGFRFLDSDQQQWNATRTVLLKAPVLSILSFQLMELNGNNNGRPDPGELLQVVLKVANNGESVSPAGFMSLSSNNEQILVSDEQMFSPLPAAQNQDYVFEINIDAELLRGSTVQLPVLVFANGYFADYTVPLRIGAMIDDAESGDFTYWPWTQASNNAWFADNSIKYQGDYSFRSAIIGDNQNSVLSIDFQTPQDDSVHFYRKVSSEEYYDFLRFFIDDQLIQEWSGELDWVKVSYPVGAGAHNLRWEYVKDEIISANQDAAWIDDVELPVNSIFDLVNITDIAPNNERMLLYPNPANDRVHLKIANKNSEMHSYRIFALDGRLVHHFSTAENYILLDVKEYKAGMYLLQQCSMNGACQSLRFVLSR